MRQQKGFNLANVFAVILGLLCVAAIVIAYFFIQQYRDQAFEKNIFTLNELQRLDGDWSTAVLKTRSHSLHDFDEIAAYLPKIKHAFNTLESAGFLKTERVGEKAVQDYQVYKHTFEAKQEAVEQYKSEQAILRNSVRYLPTISRELKETLEKGLNRDLSQSVEALHPLLYQFITLPNVSADTVRQKLKAVVKLAVDEEQNVRQKIDAYSTHAKLILDHEGKARDLLDTAMNNKMSELSANLVQAYSQHQSTLNQRIERLQQVMLGSALLLLVIALWILSRLRKSSVKVSETEAENKATREQLLQTKQQMGQAHKKILDAERLAASGQLAMGTLKNLQPVMSLFDGHIDFMEKLKEEKNLTQQAGIIDSIVNDMGYVRENLDELNTLVEPNMNRNKLITFDLNKVVLKAIDAALGDIAHIAELIKQLGDVPTMQGSPVDMYQITVKLLRQAAEACQHNNEIGHIFVKTWATEQYISLAVNDDGFQNVYSEEQLNIIRELVESNQGIFKITPTGEKNMNMIWVSFPLDKSIPILK